MEFSQRLESIVNRYNERSEADILDYEAIQADTAEQMLDLIFKLREELKPEGGVDFQLKAFYDILEFVQKKHGFEFDPNKMWELAEEIKQIVENTIKYPEWRDREDLKAQLKMEIIVKLHQYKYPPITQEEVYKEVLEQAENF